MKNFARISLVFGMFLFAMSSVIAQVSTTISTTGTVTPSTVVTNSPYASLNDAITALNTVTALTGTLSVTCSAGSETTPTGGYSITFTATTSATNNVVITGTGVTLTAFTPQASGVKNDAFFKIIGCDYVTLQGFTMNENASNTTTTVASNNMTEWGVGLFASSTTNGAQNNTIQNNTISLSNATSKYQNAIGIFSSTASSVSNGAQAAASIAGTNSNNKFYGNTITGVAQGLYFISPAQTATVFESGNDIGGTSTTTGNNITFGYSNTAGDLGYTSYSGATPAGVYFRNVVGNTTRFNTITSVSTLALAGSGLTAAGGVFSANGTNPTGITYTTTISNNTINLSAIPSSTATMTGIDFAAGLSTGTIVCSNNSITINQTSTISVSGAVIGIKANYASATATANSNQVTFNQTFTPTSATQTNSSAFTGVTIAGASTTLNANSNIVTVNQLVNPGTTITAATLSGQMTGVSAAATANTVNTNNNQVNINQTAQPGGTTATATISSTVLGINSSATGNTGAVYTANYNRVNVNQSSNITASGASTVSITGQVNGIQVGGSNTTGGSTNVLGDTIILSRVVSQIAGQTTTFGNSTTAFIGVSAITTTTTLTVGSSTASDQNIVQVRDGTSANGTVTYNAGTVTMLSLGSSTATTSAPVSTSNVIGNRLNTGSAVNTTTGATIRCTGTFSGISIPNQGALNTVSDNRIIIDRVASGGTVFGYNQSTSPSELADTIKNNTITFTSLAGSAAPTGISALGGTGTTPKTVNGNTISISGAHTGTSQGIAFNWSGATVVNNGITITSVSPTVVGINFNGASMAGAAIATGNTLSLGSSTTSPTSMIGVNGAVSGPFTIYNNTFSALNFTGVITGSPVVSGIAIAAGASNMVRNNTITNISVGAATSTANPTVDGVLISGGVSTNVYKNKIYGITSNCTGTTGVVNGIRISGGGTTANNVYNNLIGDLTAPASANTDGIRGIGITSTTTTTTHNVYYNTININASSTGANFGTTGIFHTTSTTATTSALNLRNNIIVNNSTAAGTGIIACYRRSSTTLTNFASTSNNNNFYSSTGSVMHDGTTPYNITAYKTLVAPRDAASFREDPEFQSTVGSSSDFLKFKVTAAKQIESGGVNIATYTDDYNGTIRQGNGGYAGTGSAPDMGGWELEGIPQDLVGPTISYTNFGATSCGTDRTLSPVTVTDASSVNTTSGTRPRMYYRKSTNANTYVDNTNATDGWKYVEATGASGSPFSFTTDYSLLFGGAPTTGNTVEYFIVAQDLATTPNVGINSGTFNSTPSSVALTATAFPLTGAINSYTIVAAGLSGTKTIGAAGDYPSLTGAGGLFDAINVNGLSAALTVNIVDATVTESGINALNAINYNGCAVGPYNVSIQPGSGVTTVLSGSFASGALVKLNGADNVTIDGSNNGSSSQNMTITNTSTTTPSVISIASTGVGAGATNNTIKNCLLSTGVSSSLVGYGISIGGSAVGSGGADNDNVTIQNNTISVAAVGIYANGTASVSSGGLDNLTITGNSITYNGALASCIGIQVGNSLNSTISQNTVSIESSTTTAPVAISLETGFVSSTVTRNNITKAYAPNSGGYGGRGITVGTGTATSSLTIANNMISGVNGSNWNAFGNSSSMGIAIGTIGGSSTLTTTAGGINLYYNTVRMDGSMGSASTTAITTAIYIGSAASALDIRNNIFINTQTGTSTTQKNYAIYSAAANTAFTTINYNDYYASNSFNAGSAFIGFLTSDRATLANWQTASVQDANSLNLLPTFVSASDLHLNMGMTATQLEGGGAVIASVTTDFDNDTRPGPAGSMNGGGTVPDIGADEFDGVPVSPMTYVSSTVDQVTGSTYVGSTNQQIIRIKVVTTGPLSPLTLTSMTLNANGTTSITDINVAPAKVYYTGASTTFSTGTLVGSATPTIASFNITGSQTLLEGDNYFWLAYDVSATATNGNTIDGECTSLTIGSAYTPTVTAPAGNKVIVGAMSGNYNVGTGQVFPNFTTITNAISDLNNRGVSGAVTFTLLDATYNTGSGETFPLTINQITGASSTNTITIKPGTSVTATITGASSGAALIKLNGTDYVTIDGSNSGGNDKSLTIENTSTTSNSTVIWLASLGTGTGATDNTIKNCIIKGGQISPSTSTYGIHAASTTIGTAGDDNDNLTIQNNTIIKAHTGIWAKANSTGLLNNLAITGNTIGSATATDYITNRGITIAQVTGGSINTNYIFNMIVSSISTTLTAIESGAGVVSTNIYSNRIDEISNTGSVVFRAGQGISLATGAVGANVSVYNNMIGNLKGDGSSTATNNSWGVLVTSGGGYKIEHNTINIPTNRVSTSSTDIHGGVYLAAGVTDITLRNNLISVTGSPGNAAGRMYGIYSLSTSNFTVSNNNDLYVSGSLHSTGFYNSANRNTLSDWQTASSQDGNSFSEVPTFTSATDLHLNMGVISTQLESGGATTTVSTDYDGNVRPGPAGSMNGGATAPDIGADEFDGVPAVPMTYVSSTVTQVTGGAFPGVNNQEIIRIQVVTSGILSPIQVTNFDLNANGTTDISNINATTAKVYYTGASTTFSTGTTFGSATPTIGTFSVVGSQTLLVGNNYFWLAYDVTAGATGGNLIDGECTSITVGTPRTPTVTAPSGNKVIVGPMAGNYNVGAAESFPNFKTVTEAASNLNSRGVSAAVTITLMDATYNAASGESFPITINAITGSSSSNTIAIKPNTAQTPTISGSSTNAILVLNDADYITINGSNTGATVDASLNCGNSALRNMTISNTNTGTSSAVIALRTGTAGAQNNTIRNVNIIGEGPTTTFIGICIGGTTNGSTGADNDNNRIENCSFKKSQWGITCDGTSTANQNTGTVITQNDLSSTGTDRIGFIGISVTNENGIQITRNCVGGITATASGDAIGIAVGTESVDNATTTGGGIDNANVSFNKITGVQSTNTTGFSAAGIAIAGNNVAANSIRNNMISGVISVATSPDIVAGIFVAGVTGSSTNVQFNTVSMSGDRGSSVTSQHPSYALAITGTTPTVDNRNNILVNTQIADLTASPAAKSYAIGMSTSTYTNLTSNYNDFSGSGANYNGYRTVSLGASGTDYANNAAWNAASSKDGNSNNIAPVFTSASDLHLPVASNTALFDKGTNITGITTDIDNESRHASAPDVGADEFSEATLNLTVFIEGYYLGGNTMQPVLLNSGVTGATGTQCDTVTIQLRNSTAPYAAFASTSGILGTDGTISVKFPSQAIGNSYFIAVKSRNIIETWSGNGADIATSFSTVTTSYDFSADGSQAYGSNMKEVETGVWAIYSGDIDMNPGGDGEVNLADYGIWEIDNDLGAIGYYPSDLNGDGEVNLADYGIWEVNNDLGILLAIP